MLQLLRGEEADEGLVDDRVKPFHESYRLILDLSVHHEVGHVMDVTDSAENNLD
jgi:hypothetical protein